MNDPIDPHVTGSMLGQAAIWSARLADGPMTAGETAALQTWLDADAAHGRALEETALTWETVERYAGNPRMVAAREAALAEAGRSHRRHGRRARLYQTFGMAIAACLLVAALAGGAWLRFSPQIYETGVGERRVVALKDGSQLTLDAASTVRVAYSGEARRLWLEKGRAKFEVARDPLRPFSVDAAGKVVVATGTAFSVERLRREVRVVLYEGHIAVMERPPEGGPLRLGPSEPVIRPGQELVLQGAEAVRRASIFEADLSRSKSWESGELMFDDEPLGAAVERINRYAVTPFRIAEPGLAGMRISGVFKAGDSDAFAQGLQFAFGLTTSPGEREIIVRRPAPPSDDR